MAKLLFRMRHVPEDEAEEVRKLLDRHAIEYFETFAGNWGISMPAIWVRNESKFAEARELLDVYQAERSQRVRENYEQRRKRGEIRTIWDSFIEAPVRFLAYIALIGVVLYLSLIYFLSF